MLINKSNLHNYFSDFLPLLLDDDEEKKKARRKMRGEDLRIIAMTCVSNQKISLE